MTACAYRQNILVHTGVGPEPTPGPTPPASPAGTQPAHDARATRPMSRRPRPFRSLVGECGGGAGAQVQGVAGGQGGTRVPGVKPVMTSFNQVNQVCGGPIPSSPSAERSQGTINS